jgi:hypothetical protein
MTIADVECVQDKISDGLVGNFVGAESEGRDGERHGIVKYE